MDLSPAGFNMLIEWLREEPDYKIKEYKEKVEQWEKFKRIIRCDKEEENIEK